MQNQVVSGIVIVVPNLRGGRRLSADDQAAEQRLEEEKARSENGN